MPLYHAESTPEPQSQSRPLFYRTEDNRLLCSQCLQVLHDGKRGDPVLYAHLRRMDVNDTVFLNQRENEDWTVLYNRVHNMAAHLSRRMGRSYRIKSMRDEGKFLIVRTK